MLGRLFKPKWDQNDPATRRKALESGEVPSEVVTRMALQDSAVDVRLAAIERLQCLYTLHALATAPQESAVVREAAAGRQREILALPEHHQPSVASRVEMLQVLHSPSLCAFLARSALAAEVRLAALAWVADSELLCTVAVEDPVAAVRRAALERTDDPVDWEVIARRARNKDRQISRTALARLEAYRAAVADAEQAQRLCEAIEALAANEPSNRGRSELQRITAQWQRLDSALPPPLLARFEAASERLTQAIQRFESRYGERSALCSELDALLGTLNDENRQDAGLSSDESDRMQRVIRQWQELGSEAAEPELVSRFSELERKIRAQSERQLQDLACAERLRPVIAQAQARLHDASRLEEHHLAKLERRWQTLSKPQSQTLASKLQEDFASALQSLRARLKQQRETQRKALDEAERFQDELEAALQSGQLERAISLRDRIRHRLKASENIDSGRRSRLQQRLHAFEPRLDNMREWRHWGSAQSRERLCDEIEALAQAPLAASETATRVRSARDAWKRIDRAEGPAAAELWQRFDQACTQAYRPFQEQQEKKSAQQQAQLEQKQALCASMEEMERDTDWKTVDWSDVDTRFRHWQRRWRRIGPVPRKDAKALERRFREASLKLDQRLAREREREVRRRQALIARLEALLQSEDIRAGVDEAKAAQKQWKPSVQAERKIEQALWKQFRAACDQQFGRLEAERHSAEQEREANLEHKQALCEELEAALQDESLDAATLARTFAGAAGRWETIGPLPRGSERSLTARYQALHRRLADREVQAATAAAADLMEGVRQRAELCAHLETSALADSATLETGSQLVEDVHRVWSTLAPLGAEQVKVLEARLELASRVLAGDSQALESMLESLQGNLERRLELCLELEVAAGVESPSQFAEQRLRLQASRLQDALARRLEGQELPDERLRRIQMEWYLAGPVQHPLAAELEARFQRALVAIAP
jgi:hypothetical protein